MKEEIQRITSDCFQLLLKSQRLNQNQIIFEAVETKVTEEMNNSLIAEFIPEEIHEAIKHMHPTKAPGPDGITALFFKKYWHIVGKMLLVSVWSV